MTKVRLEFMQALRSYIFRILCAKIVKIHLMCFKLYKNI